MTYIHRGPGGLTIEAPVREGLIRVLGFGFWSPAIVDAHFHELRNALVPYRNAGSPGRMFVDLRTTDIQSPETVARMQEGVSSVTQEGDRYAIVVASSLAKMQMRRIIGSAQHEFFVSPDAALTWVGAFE